MAAPADLPALARPLLAGWPMRDADRQASRRSTWSGATKGKLAWSWAAPAEDLYMMNEPVVAAGGDTIIVPSSSPQLFFLSAGGALQREVVLPHPPWSDPLLAEDGTLYATAWQLLLAYARDGTPLGQKSLPGFVKQLRWSPAGALLAFTSEKGWVQIAGEGSRDKPVYPELGRWAGELHAAFDQAGNLYASDTDHWRGSPDEDREQFSRIAGFDPSGKQLWRRDLSAPRATDEPEYCVMHIWGTGEAAVFFGDTRICSHDSRGQLLWAIARPSDFAGVVEIPQLGLTIASDPRLRSGPRVVTVHGRGWEFKVCALDSAGRVYFCVPFQLVCLEPDYRLRWACELPAEHLYDPIIGPGGTVLARSFRTLYSVE